MGTNSTASRKLVGLFLAAALVAAPGCAGTGASGQECPDTNNDGYCDDSGGRAGGGGTYIGGRGGAAGSGGAVAEDGVNKPNTGISSGVSKGGIGSSSISSGS